MRFRLNAFMILIAISLVACTRETCPEGAISYLDPPYPAEIEEPAQPQVVEIGKKQMEVDEVISGTLCNDSWSGTVYVLCDLQIPAWKGEGEEEVEALFFQDCDLEIAPNTVVYVEAHGDQAYYQGCSCHQESSAE